MQIPVVVEKVAGNGFRARGGAPWALVADGPTRDEALSNLRQMIEERLAEGSELVTLEVPAADLAWEQMAGMFEDDPLFDEWQEAIEEYRDRCDQDSDGA